MEVANLYAKEKFIELNDLLRESNRRLNPLEDPLKIDFGLHRWLTGEREEAYSDWLAWILEKLSSPELIGMVLFGDNDFLTCKGICKSDREVWIPIGGKERTGRLDIVLRFESEAIIVIEVKVIDADYSDTSKQAGYKIWLDDQKYTKHRYKILIATKGSTENHYHGFTLLLWEDLCKRLRKILPKILEIEGLTIASLVLAFVSAVEQNLVGLPSLRFNKEPFKNLQIFDFGTKVFEYLRNTLEEGEL